MRTTVTLEKDVERLLREAMHRTRQSFKETLNAAIREGLANARKPKRQPKYVVKPFALQLRAGIDPARMNQLADDLEAEAVMELTRRSESK